MRVVVTGGGTGGHIYPALEVAREAADRGAEILYYGSIRGQESGVCKARGISFRGFASEPLLSLRTVRGWSALSRLLRASSGVKRFLKEDGVEAVFSTGGYSAAPVMSAARSLGLRYTIHEANSVPGRANRLFGRRASAFTCTFRATPSLVPAIEITRTGHPIRRELRSAAAVERPHKTSSVLVVGGSQGSEFLNSTMPVVGAILRNSYVRIVHSTGRKNFEAVRAANPDLGERYELKPYLETEEIAETYRSASVVVARSGSTVAEFALFGLPSVLVPLPSSADQHQLHNAMEFVQMEAAVLQDQSTATPESIARSILHWLDSADRRERAGEALHAWDAPDATQRITDLLLEPTR